MKREAFRRELEQAYPTMPEATRQAFEATVHRLREEPAMRRKLTWVPALILALALLCGTALALINHFSVRDLHDYVDPNVPIEENITTIHERYENDHVEIYFGDALFDGQNFTIAFELTPKNPDERVLLYPILTAEWGGEPLNAYMYSGVAGIDQGILYPSRGGTEMIWHDYGIEAVAYDDTQINFKAYTFGEKPAQDQTGAKQGPVAWTLRMLTLAPNWPIIFDNDPMVMEDPALSGRSEDRMQTAYERGIILATGINDVMPYAFALPVPEGYDAMAWDALPYHERLIESGAFSLADAVDCVFETPVPETTRMGIAAGTEIPMDGYTIVIDSIYSSFFSLGYLMHIDLPNGGVTDPLLAELFANNGHFEPFTPSGESAIDFLNYGTFSEEHEDGSITVNFQADGFPQGPLPESLTFVPFIQTSDHEKNYLDKGSFTIPLN